MKFDYITKKGNIRRRVTQHSTKSFAKDQILEHALDVPQGEKTWNFSFDLTNDLRSTFNGKNSTSIFKQPKLLLLKGSCGSTKYIVKCHVDLPGFDKTETAEFNVNHYRYQLSSSKIKIINKLIFIYFYFLEI